MTSTCGEPAAFKANRAWPAPVSGQPVRVSEYLAHLTPDGQAARISRIDIDSVSFDGHRLLTCPTASVRLARVLTLERVQGGK